MSTNRDYPKQARSDGHLTIQGYAATSRGQQGLGPLVWGQGPTEWLQWGQGGGSSLILEVLHQPLHVAELHFQLQLLLAQ